jgi:hypothetical protein
MSNKGMAKNTGKLTSYSLFCCTFYRVIDKNYRTRSRSPERHFKQDTNSRARQRIQAQRRVGAYSPRYKAPALLPDGHMAQLGEE